MAGIKVHSRTSSQDLGSQYMSQCGENDFRHQVVAVGTPLPSLPIGNVAALIVCMVLFYKKKSKLAGSQQGPVMLTAKNLQCMRALLHLAHCHGSILGTSWHIVLATLQHLVWILGLKPSTGGSLQVRLTFDFRFSFFFFNSKIS